MSSKIRFKTKLRTVLSSRFLLLLSGVLLVTGAVAYHVGITPFLHQKKTPVTKPSNVTFTPVMADICAGGGVVNLNNIVINEANATDFREGKGTLVLSFTNPNFAFTGNPTATVTLSGGGGSISTTSTPAITNGKIKFDFDFRLNARSDVETITITGLEAQATDLATGSADIKISGDLDNIQGLDATATLGTVTVTNPAAVNGIIVGPNIIHDGQTIIFTAPTINGVTEYEWDLTAPTGALTVSGSSSQQTISYVVAHTGAGKLEASLRVRAKTGSCKGKYSAIHPITIYNPLNLPTGAPKVNLTIPSTTVCQGTGTTTVTLGDIVITERAATDFTDGGHTAALFPENADFAFVESAIPTITLKINETSVPATNISFDNYNFRDTLRRQLLFDYNLTGSAGSIDSITISGLQVSTNTVGTTNILVGDTGIPIALNFGNTLAKVTVVPPPTGTGTITGANTMAIGQTETFTVSGITGANVYQWTVPAGFLEEGMVVTATDMITLTANSTVTSANLTVTGINNNANLSCGGGTASSTVTVQEPVTITKPTKNICVGSEADLGDIVIAENAPNGILPFNNNRAFTLRLPTSGGLEFVTSSLPTITSTSTSNVFQISGQQFINSGHGTNEFKFNILFPTGSETTLETLTISGIRIKANNTATGSVGMIVTSNAVNQIRGLLRDEALATLTVKPTPGAVSFDQSPAFICKDGVKEVFKVTTTDSNIDAYDWSLPTELVTPSPLSTSSSIEISSVSVGRHTLRVRGKNTTTGCVGPWLVREVEVKEQNPGNASTLTPNGPAVIQVGSTNNTYSINPIANVASTEGYLWKWSWTDGMDRLQYRNALTTINTLNFDASGIQAGATVNLTVRGVSDCGVQGAASTALTINVEAGGISITQPSQLNLCTGSGVQNLGPIVLTERDRGAFQVGKSNIELTLANTTDYTLQGTPSVIFSGTGASGSASISANVLTLNYEFKPTSTSVINSIIISGIQVSAARNVTSTDLTPTNISTVNGNEHLTGVNNSTILATVKALETPTIPTTFDTKPATNTVCEGTEVIYGINVVTGATYTYDWSIPSGYSVTSMTRESLAKSNQVKIMIPNGAISGTIALRLNNSNGCTSTTISEEVQVIALPAAAGSITGNNNICAGTTHSYEVPRIDRADSYEWVFTDNGREVARKTTTSNFVSFTADNVFTTSDMASVTGKQITLTVQGVSTACGAGTSATYNIDVNRTQVEITGLATEYNSQSPDIPLSASSNGTPLSPTAAGLRFTGPGVRQNASGAYFLSPSSLGVGNYTIECEYTTPTRTQCVGQAQATFNIITLNALGLANAYCDNDQTAHKFQVQKVLRNFRTSIEYIHSLDDANGMNPDRTIAGNNALVASSGLLNPSNVNAPNNIRQLNNEAFHYTFTPHLVNNQSQINIFANVIKAEYDPTSGDLIQGSVQVERRPLLSMPININEVPSPTINPPGNRFCADNQTEHTFSIGNSNNNSTYNWRIENDPSVASGTVVGDFIGGNMGSQVRIRWRVAGNHRLFVTETRIENNVSCDGPSSLGVVVNALPNVDFSATSAGAPANTSTNLPSACQRTITTYKASVTTGLDYRWVATNGNIRGSSTNSTVDVQWTGAGSGTLSLTVIDPASSCSSTVMGTVNIINTVGFATNQRVEACKNEQNVVYTITDPTPTEGTITWNVTGGIVVTSDATSVTVNWGNADNGTVTVSEDILGSCNTTQTLEINIRDLPIVGIGLSSAYCANTTTDPVLRPIVNGSSILPTGTGSYTLNKLESTGNVDVSGFVNATTNVLEIQRLISNAASGGPGGPGDYQIQYTFTNVAGCRGSSAVIDFKIESAPDVSFNFVNAPTPGYCANAPSVFVRPTIAGGTFSVMKGGVAVDPIITQETNGEYRIDISTLAVLAADLPGTYAITYTRDIGNNCRETSPPQNFVILPLPAISFNLPSTRACIRDGGVINLMATVTEPGGSAVTISTSSANAYFEVRRQGNSSFQRLASGAFDLADPTLTGTPPTTTAGWNMLAGAYELRFTYTSMATTGSCTVTSETRTFTVDPLPIVGFSGLSDTYCIDAGEVTLEPFVDGAPPATGTGEFKVYRQSDNGLVKSLSGNTFKPSDATVLPTDGLREGDYFLEYRFTSDKNCTEISASQKFSIKAAPQVNFKLQVPAPVGNKYCVDGSQIVFEPDRTGGVFTIQNTSVNGAAPIVLDREVVSVNISDLATNESDRIGVYSVSYTFTETSGSSTCSGTVTNTTAFEIVPLPNLRIVDINKDGYCAQGGIPFQLKADINNGAITPPGITTAPNNVFFEVRRKSGARGVTNFTKLTLPDGVTLTDMFDPRRPISSEAQIPQNASTDQWNELVGEYEVRYTYKDGNNCSNTSQAFVIKINALPKLSFTGLQSAYCDDVDLVTLTPFDGESRITSSVSFKYRRISETTFTPFSQGNSFSPKSLGAGTYEIVLESDASGCVNSSNRDNLVTVVIEPTPKDVRVMAVRDYDKNTVKFSATAGNINNQWQWNWDFRDGTSSTMQNPVKTLPNALPQIIRYTLTPSTEKNCQTSVIKDFKMDFDVEGFCLGSPTKFTNKSVLTGDSIGSITWDFDDGSGTATGKVVEHQYQKPGTYNVKLTVTTNDNIATYVLRRRIDIFPVVVVTEQQFYTEGFESGTSGWISHGVVDVDRILVDSTSWKLKQPDGFLIRNTTGNAWVTDNRDNPHRTATNANYNSNEQSYVESPCFDIGGLTKPLISFHYWSDTDQGADGVVLLYTIDDGKTWNRLGKQNLGIDWYNTKLILGAPGAASNTLNVVTNRDNQGWSGQSQIIDGKWRFARFSLTEVLVKMNDLKITDKIVRFRMSFGSNGDNPPDKNFDGFAFDNVVIGNRNRIVLLEYFINEGIANAEAADLRTKNFPQTGNQNEVISIHHHTDFPGIDALNKQNEKDPSARSFYHGIREVPRVVIDGYFNDTLMAQWTQDYFADRTLITSPFYINVGQPSVSGTTFKVSASVTAIQNFDRPVIMHVVLIDSVVNVNGKTFYNVVRKMLPDAAGTYKKTGWALGDSETLDFSWDIGSLDAKSFRVVVFVEDYETKEVHQAAVTNVRRNRNTEGQSEHQVTSVAEDLLHSGGKIFPNPALKTIQVQLDTGRKLSAGATWEVISIKGALVKKGVWKPGRQSMSIGVSELSDGFYIFRIIDQAKKLQLQLRFEKQ